MSTQAENLVNKRIEEETKAEQEQNAIKNRRDYYPTEKQQLAITCPCKIIFFGGSRGGGKSAACRFKIMQHAQMYGPNARMVFMRRSIKELEQFIDNCRTMYDGIAVWKEQKKRFEFRNGAVCEFNYLEGDSIHNYQGREYTLIILDEVGQFDSYDDIRMLLGCLRSSAGVPTQLFMTGNPGGRLHNILKAEFIDPAPQGMVPIENTDAFGNKLGTYRIYIPSTLFENPHLTKNDPEYITNLMQQGSPELVRAWIKGDWNIISGGAFDKLFDRDIHVIKPFAIPEQWRIVECYDDGMTKPAAAVWFAISDGSDYYLPNGERRTTIRGDIFVIGELYFWTGKPNEGSAESVQMKAQKILQKEKALGYEISQRIADSAIFSTKTHSIADEFMENGLAFDRCNKAPGSRIHAANIFRSLLMGSIDRKEKPGIFWFNTCVQCIRTIPTIPRDKQNPDDVDSKAEDHCLHGDTIIHTIEYGDVPIRELVGKEGHCLTAGGYYTRFYNCKCYQKNASMLRIDTVDKKSIVCTNDHRILKSDLNYAEAQEWMSELYRKQFKISTVEGFTSVDHISDQTESCCTEQSMNTILEKYQKVLSYITKTEISQIIRSAICNLWQANLNIIPITKKSTPKKEYRNNALKQPKNGTIPLTGKNGIDSIISEIVPLKCTKQQQELVKFAEKLLSQQATNENTVASTMPTSHGIDQKSMTNQERALYAEISSLVTAICTLKPARRIVSGNSSVKSIQVCEEKSDAYCLTTDCTHSIVVNDGIVVSNCLDCHSYLFLSDCNAEVQVGSAGNC